MWRHKLWTTSSLSSKRWTPLPMSRQRSHPLQWRPQPPRQLRVHLQRLPQLKHRLPSHQRKRLLRKMIKTLSSIRSNVRRPRWHSWKFTKRVTKRYMPRSMTSAQLQRMWCMLVWPVLAQRTSISSRWHKLALSATQNKQRTYLLSLKLLQQQNNLRKRQHLSQLPSSNQRQNNQQLLNEIKHETVTKDKTK